MSRVTPGSVVGHYRVERPLGAGAMGEVYLARDTRLDRDVAVKLLLSGEAPEQRRRILREARAIAAIDHPAICSVYEVGSDDDLGDFIVMQYVEGETLAARLRRGRLPPDEAIRVAASIAAALEVAHERGVVHRDLKPHNVMILRDGSPKLLDFGIARRLPSEADAGRSTATASSRLGQFAGTPAYASPEQCAGQPVDGRSDLFSLGCVLYECLTGRRAFTGDTPFSVVHAVLGAEPPSPSSIVPELGAAHDDVCAALLHKDRNARMQSAGDAREALLALTQGRSDAARRHGTPRRSRRPWLGAAAVVVLMIAAAWMWRPPAVEPPPDEAAQWFARGVEHLREGSYGSAKASFEQAVEIHPDYLLAHARMAEALMELDEQEAAKDALLRVQRLRAEGQQLSGDDALRLDAVMATAQREMSRASGIYRQLAGADDGDARRWVDVGRAEEAASNRLAARDAFARAVELDPQYGAAHLNLGRMQAQSALREVALATFAEAERLFRAASNLEGEAEVALQKAILLTNMLRLDEAVATLAIVDALAGRFQTLEVRARFQHVRIAMFRGDFDQAESIATEAVAVAVERGLHAVAADGLLAAGAASQYARRFDEAEDRYRRAISTAAARRALRTEQRATLQLASLEVDTGDYEQAASLGRQAMAYFEENEDLGNSAKALLIVSRAEEGRGQFAEASELARRARDIADALDDQALRAEARENLAGQFEAMGLLPQALAEREAIDALRASLGDETTLAWDIPNRAELLIGLGRTDEARSLLAEFQARIDAGEQVFVGRRSRMLLVVAQLESVDGNHAAAEEAARALVPAERAANPTLASALLEFALAARGRPGLTTAEVFAWSSAGSPGLAYWAARVLIARREFDAADRAAVAGLQRISAGEDSELYWRLQACGALSRRLAGDAPGAAAASLEARNALQKLLASWPAGGASYTARADFEPLIDAIGWTHDPGT